LNRINPPKGPKETAKRVTGEGILGEEEENSREEKRPVSRGDRTTAP